jgi:hypothetical protein
MLILAIAGVLLGSDGLAQTKRQAVPMPTATPEPASSKKNERPGSVAPKSQTVAAEPTYYYEFSQPEFVISKIVIEHDDAGAGTITFTKKLFRDTVTEPVTVSPDAMEKINAAYATLNFLNSTESYQYEKDYSHLGVMTFKLKKGDKQRSAVFNFTVNKDAKILMDEYRKLGNQFIWMFDISVARENQPLEAPKLLDSLDSQMRRGEMSDPMQLVPLLKGLTNDERVPLIARNHAGKLAERIEKGKK